MTGYTVKFKEKLLKNTLQLEAQKKIFLKIANTINLSFWRV